MEGRPPGEIRAAVLFCPGWIWPRRSAPDFSGVTTIRGRHHYKGVTTIRGRHHYKRGARQAAHTRAPIRGRARSCAGAGACAHERAGARPRDHSPDNPRRPIRSGWIDNRGDCRHILSMENGNEEFGMIGKALLAALIALAVASAAESAANFHPLALASDAIEAAGSCAADWAPESCK